MSILSNNTIILDEVKSYIIENNDYLTSFSYYDINNIPDNLKSSNWYIQEDDKKAFVENIFDAISNILDKQNNSIFDETESCEQNKEILFNDLSTMVVNVFIPLTNLRYTEYCVLLKNKEKITINSNSLLIDSTITSDKQCNSNSRIIISTKEQFISYNDCENKIKNISKENKIISIQILYDLINVCYETTNYIRKSLSCKYEDASFKNESAKVYYYSLSTDVLKKGPYNTIRYSNYTLSSYTNLFGIDDPLFNGWKIKDIPESEIYQENTDFFIDKDITNFIANEYNGLIVNYRHSNGTLGITDKTDIGNVYNFRSFENSNLGNLPEDGTFVGWSINPELTVISYSENQELTANKNVINVYAVYSKTITEIKENPVLNIYGFNINVSNGNTLNTLLTTAGSQYLNDISLLVGFKITNNIKRGSSTNDNDNAYFYYNGNNWYTDKMGDGIESNAGGVIYWQSSKYPEFSQTQISSQLGDLPSNVGNCIFLNNVDDDYKKNIIITYNPMPGGATTNVKLVRLAYIDPNQSVETITSYYVN